jgi:hypothetical protein
MEITNFSQTSFIVLPVGERVAQIVFLYRFLLSFYFLSSGVPSKQYTGKYQQTLDIERLKEEWTPQCMLPRLYLEEELKEQ